MPSSSDHPSHDPELIAAHAGGDLAGAQLVLASRLTSSCEDCARLHADLLALAAATRSLPANATAPRDYRLSTDQAERLRRGGLVRRLLRPFANPASGVRPLAVTFSGLGAIGLAVVMLVPLLGASMASAPVPAAGGDGFTAAGATAAPAEQPVFGVLPGPTAGTARDHVEATAQPGEADAVDENGSGQASGGKTASATASVGTNPSTILLIASLVLLATGVGLLALRILARRVA